MDFTSSIELHFDKFGRWVTLPSWAEYFVRVGKHIDLPSNIHESYTNVIAIIVPTRAFGAALTCLGSVINNSQSQFYPLSKGDHFEVLAGAPSGTPVLYFQSERKGMKGVLKGSEKYHGLLYLRVQVQSEKGGSLTHLVDKNNSYRVQFSKHSGELPSKQKKTNSDLKNELINFLFWKDEDSGIKAFGKPSCKIIGSKKRLENEVCKTPLDFYVNGKHYISGSLQDILRIDQFSTATQLHRSMLLPTDSFNKEVLNMKMTTVFDGALGFLNLSSSLSGCNQVVILDRADNNFNDAIGAINSRISQNSSSSEMALPECNPPPGVEVVAFREKVK
ncbi:hypothetical protein ABMA57_00995 [Saccharospirillum sp. HFRX-1]|uniref:hypothetical protein n=1 Tax=unclassified Saccharospirillum TaxID=2633430 RepID=UPI003714BF4D